MYTMQTVKYVRGSVWMLNYTANSTIREPGNSVQSGRRPVLIVSNNMHNLTNTSAIVVPLTSQDKKQLPTHAEFYIDNIKNTALAESIQTIPKSMLGSFMGILPDHAMKAIDKILAVAIDLTQTTPAETRKEETEEECRGVEERTALRPPPFKKWNETHKRNLIHYKEKYGTAKTAKIFGLGESDIITRYKRYCEALGITPNRQGN